MIKKPYLFVVQNLNAPNLPDMFKNSFIIKEVSATQYIDLFYYNPIHKKWFKSNINIDKDVGNWIWKDDNGDRWEASKDNWLVSTHSVIRFKNLKELYSSVEFLIFSL